MRLGIIGLPQSGKTTLFNALTRGDQPVGSRGVTGGGRFEVHTAVVSVPDPRVDALSALFKPRKTIYAQVTYADIAGLEAEASKSGFSGPLLNQLAAMDGFLNVVRVFENPTVPHPAGSINPARDLATLDGELLLNDMLAVERKLERLNEEAKKGIVKDKGLHAQEALAADQPLRDVELPPIQEKLLSSYQLLTRKPMLVVFNTGDEGADPSAGSGQVPAKLPAYPHARSAVVALQGKLEMEIAQLPPDEAVEFLKEYGIAEPSLNRMIRLSYDLLGLESFFTVGEDEVRAWTVRRGASAPEAAGEVHTDLQKGFIRAEVVSYSELVHLGGYAEVKAKGKLRLEGKEYVVQDGDILNIRFSPPTK
ncbi:MAG: redox-regulated ATPase YchF [Chloroflexi bacterium RBG_16_63_12]|nr:MAG: redox-regulated ATPase YchF [Chloroflexi bacterium RBG_16_63_12]